MPYLLISMTTSPVCPPSPIHSPLLPLLDPALSSLAYPSAPFDEERWVEGPEADSKQERRNALISSLTTSTMSILHLNHPTTPPSGHVTTATTDTTDTVPHVSELWVTGRGIHGVILQWVVARIKSRGEMSKRQIF